MVVYRRRACHFREAMLTTLLLDRLHSPGDEEMLLQGWQLQIGVCSLGVYKSQA